MEILLILVSICVLQAQQATANKRPIIIIGGQRVMSQKQIEKDDILLEGIREAKERLNSKCHSEYHLVTNTITATSQVVEGILYRVRIEIGPSDEKEKIQDCLLRDLDCSRKCVCTFTVWSRVWEKDPAKKLIVGVPKCQEKT